MNSQIMRMRVDDLMVTTLTKAEPAVLDFEDILEATRVMPADCSQAPWQTCDGLDHHVVTDNTDGKASGSFDGARRGRQGVVLDYPERWGNFAWHRARGASKQVAFELAPKNGNEPANTLPICGRTVGRSWVLCATFVASTLPFGESRQPIHLRLSMNPALNPLVAKSPARLRTGWNKRDTGF